MSSADVDGTARGRSLTIHGPAAIGGRRVDSAPDDTPIRPEHLIVEGGSFARTGALSQAKAN